MLHNVIHAVISCHIMCFTVPGSVLGCISRVQSNVTSRPRQGNRIESGQQATWKPPRSATFRAPAYFFRLKLWYADLTSLAMMVSYYQYRLLHTQFDHQTITAQRHQSHPICIKGSTHAPDLWWQLAQWALEPLRPERHFWTLLIIQVTTLQCNERMDKPGWQSCPLKVDIARWCSYIGTHSFVEHSTCTFLPLRSIKIDSAPLQLPDATSWHISGSKNMDVLYDDLWSAHGPTARKALPRNTDKMY